MTAASALQQELVAAMSSGRKLLVPYVTCGFPDASTTATVLDGLAGIGVDAIEIGVPFSDPLADGPVIAAASERALASGASVEQALTIAGAYWRPGKPRLVLFTYMNPVAAFGADALVARCLDASVGGVLVADLPFDEDPAFQTVLGDGGVPVIRLAAPTTPEPRLRELGRGARGFVYLIARTGVTGTGAGTDRRVAEQVAVLRDVTDLPILVGFGIDDPESARRAAEVADGVVVGSAFVKRLDDSGPEAAVDWMAQLRGALDRG